MYCPKCGKEVSFHTDTCSQCGVDLTVYRKIISASNSFYNDGLAKAKVRDLSGAVVSLKKSLKLYKKNTNARNLLGLVYYEMGEAVSALSEWVLSKHFEENNKDADRYMNAVQSNQARLETINQSIKKYNSALNYAKQGNCDLAIMQLEKVTSLNPKFVRNYQLLALLYLKSGKKEKAAKYLTKAQKIDVNNTLTLRYMEEIPGAFSGIKDKKAKREKKDEVKPVSAERPRHTFQPEIDVSSEVFHGSSYSEDKFNIWPYLNLVIGAVLGIAVVYFLLVPTAKKSVAEDYEAQFKQYTDELATQNAKTNSLEGEKKALEKKQKELQKQLDDLKAEGISEETYENFFESIILYMNNQKTEAAILLANVKETAIEGKKAKELYNKIKEDTFVSTAEQLSEQGRVTYNQGRYQEAIELLEKAMKMDKTNTKAIYFLGRANQRLGKNDKAREYYNTIINDFPDSERVAEANRRLNELN